MPYKLRKAPKRNLYWVIGEDGSHKSKEPLPKERAKAQMRALYASMKKRGGGIQQSKDSSEVIPEDDESRVIPESNAGFKVGDLDYGPLTKRLQLLEEGLGFVPENDDDFPKNITIEELRHLDNNFISRGIRLDYILEAMINDHIEDDRRNMGWLNTYMRDAFREDQNNRWITDENMILALEDMEKYYKHLFRLYDIFGQETPENNLELITPDQQVQIQRLKQNLQRITEVKNNIINRERIIAERREARIAQQMAREARVAEEMQAQELGQVLQELNELQQEENQARELGQLLQQEERNRREENVRIVRNRNLNNERVRNQQQNQKRAPNKSNRRGRGVNKKKLRDSIGDLVARATRDGKFIDQYWIVEAIKNGEATLDQLPSSSGILSNRIKNKERVIQAAVDALKEKIYSEQPRISTRPIIRRPPPGLELASEESSAPPRRPTTPRPPPSLTLRQIGKPILDWK